MKLPRILSVIFGVTFFCILYVHQQAEIIRLGYSVQKQARSFQELLDKNSLLRYNIEKSASLIRIGDKISASKNFQMPDTYRLVVLTGARTAAENRQLPKRESFAERIFGVKRQAEAGVISR